MQSFEKKVKLQCKSRFKPRIRKKDICNPRPYPIGTKEEYGAETTVEGIEQGGKNLQNKKRGDSAKEIITESPHTDNLANFDYKLINNNKVSNQHNPKSLSFVSIAVINCQSLLAKKTMFAVFIDENKPDIVVGSESWLSPSVNNHEVFPHDYIVHRKDRADNYGGVFVACT